jgi:hypothetical protein
MNDRYQGCCCHLGTRLALAVAKDEQADIDYKLMMRNAIYWLSELSQYETDNPLKQGTNIISSTHQLIY